MNWIIQSLIMIFPHFGDSMSPVWPLITSAFTDDLLLLHLRVAAQNLSKLCPVESQAADNYAEYQAVQEGGQFFSDYPPTYKCTSTLSVVGVKSYRSESIPIFLHKTASSHNFQSVTNSATLAFCPTLTGLTVDFSHAPTLCGQMWCSDKECPTFSISWSILLLHRMWSIQNVAVP